MHRCLLSVALLDQQERQSIMGAREASVQFQGLTVMFDGFGDLAGLGESDPHVLEDPGVVGVFSEAQPVRRQRGGVVAGPFQSQGFVEIVEILGGGGRRPQSVDEGVPEAHGSGASPRRVACVRLGTAVRAMRLRYNLTKMLIRSNTSRCPAAPKPVTLRPTFGPPSRRLC